MKKISKKCQININNALNNDFILTCAKWSWVLTLLTIVVLIIATCGGSEKTKDVSESNSKNISFGIIQIKNGLHPEIIYDKETQIMYIVTDGGYITPLLDSDGTPKLYEGDSD